MNKTTRNIFVRIGYILFAGFFMTLVISAKITRDQQVVSKLVVSIDHTSGNFFITEKDVLSAVSDLLPDSGTTIHTGDLKLLEQKLLEIPQVIRSNAFVNNTGQLSIEVIQRKPLYRVIRPDGQSYYVDKDGFKFPVTSKYTARVPLATGFIADNGKNSGMVASSINNQLLLLFNTLDSDHFWRSQFGQVVVSDKGELRMIPRVGSHVVVLGNADNLDDKLQRLRIFYHEAMPKAGWDTYKVINVKYKDQVVCTK